MTFLTELQRLNTLARVLRERNLKRIVDKYDEPTPCICGEKNTWHPECYGAEESRKNLLANHADAIEALVKAAQDVARYPDIDKYCGSYTWGPFAKALAALNAEDAK